MAAVKQSEESNPTKQPPKWPAECQALDQRIKHIYYKPSKPEPYYVPTGQEDQPKLIGDKLGVTIYKYDSIKDNISFDSSIGAGNKSLPRTCPEPDEHSLMFESRFESGNLAKVIRINETYYELYIRADLYTSKHMKWYYFRVTNMKKNVTYRFSFVNSEKRRSLYSEGMKPLFYSTKDARLHKIGWRRRGDNINYFRNQNVYSSRLSKNDIGRIMTYTLTFTLNFPHSEDTVYLAYAYPYTYSDLQEYLHALLKNSNISKYTQLNVLCKTVADNNVYCITVTAPQKSEETKKKAVIITARVHPGETPSSWMMKGFIDFLTGSSRAAKQLRDKFIFKLVPMLNPDGVIVGNNRVNLSGSDLNRVYKAPNKEAHPSVWHTKLMVERLIKECGVALYCDLHAHSVAHNIFMYGCGIKQDIVQLGERTFPLMLDRNSRDKFSFKNCEFSLKPRYEGTARQHMSKVGVTNSSYTIEASFAGSLLGKRAKTLFSVKDYEEMSYDFCHTFLDFYDANKRKVYENMLRYIDQEDDLSTDYEIEEVEKIRPIFVTKKRELPKTGVLILKDVEIQETESIEVEPKTPLGTLLLKAALCISIGMCALLIYTTISLFV